MRLFTPSLAFALALIAPATPASAQGEDRDWDDCATEDPAVPPARILAACEALLRLDGLAPEQLATPYFYRGRLHLAQEDWRGAIADYDRVLQLIPQEANAWYNRGTAHQALGDFARAFADYSRAIALDPVGNGYHLARGTVRYAQQDYGGALADL